MQDNSLLNIDPYVKRFKAYTESFLQKSIDDNTRKNINLKINHSLRVFKNAENIAMALNLNSEDMFIAQLTGLFHDIGRFEQFTKYNTFRDDESLYHGALGEDVLRKENLVSNLEPEMFEIICDATYNHGLIKIERENESSLLFSKIVRDADKLDIYRIVAKYYLEPGPRNIALEYGLEDLPIISGSVIEKVKNKQLITKEELKILNDFKVMQLAWIFDLNFEYSQQIVVEKDYHSIIIKTLNGADSQMIAKELFGEFLNLEN